jgi:predicted ATPase/DNA-binding XRE family transcriptional regulator
MTLTTMPADGLMTFGMLLREFRVREKLSQEELDERAQVAQDTISALERGKRNFPTAETVARLASALKLDEVDLARFEAAAKRPKTPRRRSEGSGAVRLPPNKALTNLPIELDSIVGRELLLEQARRALEAHRCVTFVGPGGVGKTRIARQVGAMVADAYGDGVWFIDLASISEPALVVERIAEAVGMTTCEDVPALEMLARFVRARRTLLIIDNCEHLVAEVATTVESLLQSCPLVQVVATSRERLGVRGERVLRVPPLSLPATTEDVTLAEIARSGAVHLFVERARAVDPDFRLCAETAGIVARICRQLDGIPFAIELAASRLDAFGVADVAQLVERRFHLMPGRYRSASKRHRTMHALLDWSFELLSTEQQVLLARLACFPGQWTADAAGIVCSFGRLEFADVLELISSLVEKSLVVATTEAGRARYRLLETTRLFVATKLDTAEKDAVRQRIAHWVAEFADRSHERLHVTPRAQWQPRMLDELDNARSSLALALHDGADVRLAARIIAGYRSYWLEEGLLAEGFRWTKRALVRADGFGDPQAEASLWLSLSWLSSGTQSVAAANEAIVRLARLGDTKGLAGAFLRLSAGYRQLARFEEALAASDRAIALFVQAGWTRSIAYASAFSWQAMALVGLRRYAEAREGHAICIALVEELGDGERAAAERINLAELDLAEGRVACALSNLDSAIRTLRGRQNAAEAAALINAAACHIVLGDLPAAHRAAADAVRLTRYLGSAQLRIFSLQHLATVAVLSGDAATAARLIGYVEACLAREGLAREPTEARTFKILSSSLEERLSPRERKALVIAGRGLSESEAVALALRSTPRLLEPHEVSG